MAKDPKPPAPPKRVRFPSEFFTEGKENPFEPRPATLPKGDVRDSKIHLAVGRALSAWEHSEDGFSRLFQTLIRPKRSSYPARRAYGAMASPKARRDLIEASAAVFFRNFPSDTLRTELFGLMKLYENAGSRRNDLAHGIIMGGPTRTHIGRYLTANLYTSKRSLKLEAPYNYTSAQIEAIRKDFEAVGNRAHHLCEDLEKHYDASPPKARAPY